MKKITFSLALAALAASQVMAIAPTHLSKNHLKLHQEQTKSLVRNAEAVPAKTRSDVKLSRNQILGDYVYDEYRYMNPGGWLYYYCIPEIVAGEEPDEIIMNGFWADWDTSVYPEVPISRVKATFDYEAQTISIPAGASLGKYGDYPAYIYISDWDTDILQDRPIVLNVNPDRSITYKCEVRESGYPVECLIVTSFPDAVGEKVDKGVDFIGQIIMNKFNTVMGIYDKEMARTDYCPAYIEPSESSFAIYNFGGYGYDSRVDFKVDFSAGTCKAPVTLWRNDVKIDDTTTTDLYYASTEGGDIVGTLTHGGEPDLYKVSIPSWSIFDRKGNKAVSEISTTSFDVSFAKAGTTVMEISGDDGAIPEYFTFQGVRVANPASGQLLIRRCGSKVEKILIP